MEDADLVRTSSLVVLGTVRRIESVAASGGRILTQVTLRVDRTAKGRLRRAKVVVTVPGGHVGDRAVHVFGAPEFTHGERALVFLRRGRDGRLRTNGLALGKYRVDHGPAGEALARRAMPTPDVRHLDRFLADVGVLAAGQPQETSDDGRVAAAEDTAGPVAAPYTFLGSPSRWFDAVVTFRRANADPGLGEATTAAAVASALAAWTDVATASLVLQDGAATSPAPSIASGACNGQSTVQFDDPYGEVDDLTGCSGVLAVGGYCTSGQTTVVNGTTFRRITEGDVTMNDGVGACWGPTNVAEVMTHEIGHAIGLGHSADATATMYAWAHFDNRGASVRPDDADGASFMYPAATTTTSSSTSTTTSTSSSTSSSSSSTSTSSTSTSSSTTSSSTTAPPASSSTSSSSTSSSTTSSAPSSTASSTTSSTATTSSTSSAPATTAPTTSTSSSTSSSSTSTSTTIASTSTTSTTTSSTTTTTLPPAPGADGDDDGVPDVLDVCPGTSAGEMTDDEGCSACPCATTVDGAPWASRLDYLRCVRSAAGSRLEDGSFTLVEARQAVRAARRSTCGRLDRSRCCLERTAGATAGARKCRVMRRDRCLERSSARVSAIDAGPGSCTPDPCAF
jgi:hypothetical protein